MGLKPSEAILLQYLKSIADSCGLVWGGEGGAGGRGVPTGTLVLSAATAYASETLRALPKGYLGESVLAPGSLSENDIQVLAEVLCSHTRAY
jgi:hypothetical protein